MSPQLLFVLLQLTATNVPHRGVAPAPFVHSELMLGQAPPRVKHNCTLFAAPEATLLLTLSTPVALVVLIVTFGVTDDPLRVADTTLPAHPRPTCSPMPMIVALYNPQPCCDTHRPLKVVPA